MLKILKYWKLSSGMKEAQLLFNLATNILSYLKNLTYLYISQV